MKVSYRALLLFFAFVVGTFANASDATLRGFVYDELDNPLQGATVSVINTSIGTITDKEGFYELQLLPNQDHIIVYSYLGYESQEISINLSPGQIVEKNITLEPLITFLPDVEIRDRHSISSHITRIDPKNIETLPGPASGVEALLKTFPGVSSVSELSTQYSVRGGNFDENLVYVNGIEIYRPFLVRAGQQEGLSFVNSDLISSINFSAGGFDAQYGDKMASVLDIRYKTPQDFGGSFSMSLLGGSAHVEGRAFESENLGYLIGVRHQTNQYLLGTLDVEGDYKPTFTDVQALLTYRLNSDWSIDFLGNYSRNDYFFEPEVQKTRFGYFDDPRQLTVYFDGQEVDRFTTAMGALSLNYNVNKDLKLQLIGSAFQSDEKERYDILGQYWMHQLGTEFGQDDFGEPVGKPLGAGAFLNHARNYLNAIVWNIEHKGIWEKNNMLFRWGLKYQHEDIYDRLREWTLLDSAGYSVPSYPEDQIVLNDFVSSRINLTSNRFSGYIQNNWELDTDHGSYILIAGVRANYWDFNNELLFSPRGTVLFQPESNPDLVIRASAGLYHQPPFYRELRNLEGELNYDIKAQESLHFVLGSELNFTAWERPFKFTSEVYYKQFNNLIPYELDNVRIRYYAENNAKGYATGLDLNVHGEFVPGIDSWASISLMKTEERLIDHFYEDDEGNLVASGYYPRPTDQLINFSLYFQDFLPSNPTYKVHIGMFYGTGLPFSPPNFDRHRGVLRMPPYRRVDIGFSKQLIGQHSNFSQKNPLQHIESMWITAEVFNLLQINNTISYMWIKDVQNRMYAVPNYLTSRLINVKLMVNF